MRKILFFLSNLICLASIATHNRSGYISYTCDASGKYTFYIHTWTNAAALAADRCDLVMWIDNIDSVHCTRVNGSNPCSNGPIGLDGVVLYPSQGGYAGIRENIYQSDVSYALNPGVHTFTMIDPNRGTGIINLGGSTSQNYAFALADTLLLSTSFPGQMNNSSPIAGFPPVNGALAGQPFAYNPGMYDPDNDSLDFALVAPNDGDPANQPGGTQPIAVWFLPNGISIDSTTGTIHTNAAPTTQGEYIVTIRVREFRRNPFTGNCNTWYVVGQTFFDFQFPVSAGASSFNMNFSGPSQLCAQSGSTVSTQVVATGTASIGPLAMDASGLPLNGTNIGTNALFSSVSSNSPVTGTFAWNASCLAVSNHSYPVYFRISDSNVPPFANFKTVFVKIVSAPPTNVSATNNAGSVTLTWTAPLNCDSHLVNYYIYRKDTCDNYVPSQCQVGAPFGYLHVGTAASSANTFADNGVSPGPHTYLVTARFADCSESLASSSACTVVGIEEEITGNDLLLFPNPSTGKLNVSLPAGIVDPEYAVTNTLGEIVLRGELKDRSIDLTAQAKGVYFAKINLGGTTVNRKIILE